MLTYDNVRAINTELKPLFQKSTGTKEEGSADTLEIVKKHVSKEDYSAIERTLVYYGEGYNQGIHAVVKALLRLVSYYSVLDTSFKSVSNSSEGTN